MEGARVDLVFVPRPTCVSTDTRHRSRSYPVYRHPADSSPPLKPFTPTVDRIRSYIEHHLEHPVNHVLIQHYRSGHDFISEHSDKTIDIVPGTKIVNVSFGAERLMILKPKRAKGFGVPGEDGEGSGAVTPAIESGTVTPATPGDAQGRIGTPRSGPPPRAAQRIPLAHNSLFVLGLETNGKWLHSIRQDKRPDTIKTPAELAYNGERISLTFRHIGTFLNNDETKIWGQGATNKSKGLAQATINGDPILAQKLIDAFGEENQSTDFDWRKVYGAGFDVLHFKSSTESEAVPVGATTVTAT